MTNKFVGIYSILNIQTNKIYIGSAINIEYIKLLKEKKSLESKIYYQKHKDRLKEKAKQWQLENPEKARESVKRFRSKNNINLRLTQVRNI